jgi:hypothetical protein
MTYYYSSPLSLINQANVGKFEVGELYKDIDREYVLCFKKEFDERYGGCWDLSFLCRDGAIKTVTVAPSSVTTTYHNQFIVTLIEIGNAKND